MDFVHYPEIQSCWSSSGERKLETPIFPWNHWNKRSLSMQTRAFSMLEKFSLRTKTHSLMLWSQCSHHDVWTPWLWSTLQEPYQPPAWQGRRQKSPPLFPRLFSTSCSLSHSWLYTFLASFLQSLPLAPFSYPSSVTAITNHLWSNHYMPGITLCSPHLLFCLILTTPHEMGTINTPILQMTA